MLHLRPFPRRTILLLAILVSIPGYSARATATHRTQSQEFKAQIQALDDNEEYLRAFSLSIDWLRATTPPTSQNQDDFLDALRQVVFDATYSGQLSLADDLSRILLSIASDTLDPNDVRVANAWRIVGDIARPTHGTRAAKVYLDQAGCMLERTGQTRSDDYARWLWSLGNWYRWPDHQASLNYLTQALNLHDALDPEPSPDSADMTAWVGWTLLHLGRHEEARQYLETALEQYQALGMTEGSTLGTVLAALGDLSAINGDWETAEGYYERATHLFEIAWTKRGATTRNIPLHGYNLIAFAQLKQGKYEQAWNSLERYKDGQTVRASVGAATWRVGSDPEYDRVRQLYNGLLQNRASAQALKEAPHVRAKTWRALVEELDLTARCMRAENDYLIKHPLPEANLHELQSRLDEHTAYIGWLDAKFADDMLTSTAPFLNARWMYMIRRSEPIQWRPIYEVRTRSQDAAVRNDSRQFYAVIGRAANWRGRVDDDPELKRLALHVFHAEFGPGAFELKGIDKLVAEFACYDEWMQSDGLVDDSGHYLSERYAVSYSPSASVYDVLVNSLHHQHASAPEVLAIGDPVYSHTSAPATDSRIDEVTLRSAINHDAGALDRLPALPYSGVEIDSVQALFHDCRVLRGDDASEVTVDKIVTRPSASKFDIVHIATHALVDRQPERCAIALSRDGTDGSVSNDGLIDASEIRMGWKLDAELVTLSACQTAGVGFHRGEPSGFAQALFQAGARCVLLTFWKVDDRATSLLMSRFYENVAAYSRHGETISYSEALEGAKNWLRTYQDAKGNRPFAHPVYWSGFVLIGDAN